MQNGDEVFLAFRRADNIRAEPDFTGGQIVYRWGNNTPMTREEIAVTPEYKAFERGYRGLPRETEPAGKYAEIMRRKIEERSGNLTPEEQDLLRDLAGSMELVNRELDDFYYNLGSSMSPKMRDD